MRRKQSTDTYIKSIGGCAARYYIYEDQIIRCESFVLIFLILVGKGM